ncbi:PGF-CTERM-anchored ABC transporter substrate-binding protein [Halobacterium zhouii]|uniref:PGF-CTERM-anchored ABC transporter substrate-binding protein n=1 Tax=Halobacterium zhouii TaxID=2902624 RepID=UPI0022B7C7CD|nr:PGF-CTERM-anchored ABC transporter substrate-binding protein [Halobacterium zhouii]
MRRSATLFGIILLVLSATAPALGVAGAQPAAQDSLECSFPLTVTDASGHEVTIGEEPQKIVTLGASAAQTMWEIGAKEKVTGISMFATYLEGADSREVVLSGRPATVDTERVVEMNPDLVFASNIIQNDTVSQIRDAGINVYRFSMATDIETIYEKTKLMGRLSGECEGAEQTVDAMRQRVNTVESAVSGEDKPRVFYGTGAGFTAGPNTFIGQVIAKAGGHNIAAEANASRPYFKMSAEFIAEQDPEYVVVGVPPSQLGNESRSYIPQDSVVRNTTAWEEGNIVVVNRNYLSQPAPRIVQPMTELASAFHPEAYAAANTTSTTEPTTTPPAATTDAASDGGTNTGTPGFGIATALVAVLGAALVARR